MTLDTFTILSLITVGVVFTVSMCAIAISVALDWRKESEWEEICRRANERAQREEQEQEKLVLGKQQFDATEIPTWKELRGQDNGHK
jgi:hypothetical protein